MLRVVSHKSAAAAKQYYTEGLKREDYYTKGEEVPGRWHGKAAALLGLSGKVEPKDFTALLENKHPHSGERLTPRTRADRIVGYDFTFNAPKSLSVLYAFTQDRTLLKSFRSAVAATMAEIEGEMVTRMKGRGRKSLRPTGNMAWAEFVHLTARPVGGLPDPHLHCHAFALNLTRDEIEDRWKAAEFRDLKKNARYFEAVFHSHLTSALAAEGYVIERNKKGWEIKGVPASVMDKFSRRTRQIEELAEAKGIRDAKLKDALGAASREGKRRGLTWADLLAAWSVRLTDEEKVAISKAVYDKGQPAGRKITAAEAVSYAVEKGFAKNSVVPANSLLEEALRVGVGQLTPDTIRKEMLRRDLLVREVKGELLCTSLEALAEEVALISHVRGGRGRMAPLGGPGDAISDKFSLEQQRAVRHVLESKDQVMAIQGKAGVGKTTALIAAVEAIEANGKHVYAFAPSADASWDTLRKSGFENAETVAYLLASEALQKRVRGQVVLIDEAGTVGVRDLWRVMQTLGPSTRVILTGDTRQHDPVPRGDAFRLLLEFAGLPAAEITQIRRQERELYRKAIESLSQGDMRAGFLKLDALGAFVEMEDEAARHRTLAQDYLALSRDGTPPLVVSPTHREGGKVTDAIRAAKYEARLLGKERPFLQYHNLQWEEADRALPENYFPGLMVQYNQNGKGVLRGEQLRVRERLADGTVHVIDRKGLERVLNLNEAGRFQVYEERQMALAKGDLIRVTKNGETADGRRLNNGGMFTVAGFDRQGRIKLNTGGVLSPDHGHLAYGYCVTSHASQSKSVRDVLVAQSSDSFVASSQAQFYVSCSRGKQTIRIYTDSRSGLQQAVGNPASRMSAVELAEFTRKELKTMSEALNGDKWRDALERRRKPAWAENVKSREGVDKTKTFLQNVLEERRGRNVKEGKVVSWEAYVDMKRKMAGPDGKNRSKGHPGEPRKGRVNGALIKRSEHTTPVRAQLKAAHEAKKAEKAPVKAANDNTKKPGKTDAVARFKTALKHSGAHFRKVMARTGEKVTQTRQDVAQRLSKTFSSRPPKQPSPKSQADLAAEHRAREKRKEPVKKPAPVKNISPVVRKGK